MTEVLDAGWVFEPKYWPHETPWERAPGECCATVKQGGYSSSQCTKSAKVEREVKHGSKIVVLPYCGTHDPAAIKARKDKRDAKWRADWDAQAAARDYATKLEAFKKLAADAIELIANGHKGARGLAQAVMAKKPAPTNAEEPTP